MLETERLILRPFSVDDFDELLRHRSDERVMEFLGGPHKPEIVSKSLKNYVAHYEQHGFAMCALIWKKTEEFVGIGGMKYIDGTDDVEVGYSVDPDFWRRGIATEVTVACLKYGFETLRLVKIIAQTKPANIGSRIVLEKCGMLLMDSVDINGEEWIRYAMHADPLKSND